MNVLQYFIRVHGSRANLLFAAGLLMFLAFLAGGCASVPVESTDKSCIEPREGIEILHHASFARVSGDPRRLEADVPRAVKQSEWGLEHLKAERVKTGEILGPDRQPYRLIRAQARTANDQTVTIIAEPESASSIFVQVRVGPFGDPQDEREFIETLNEILQGKPVKPRGGKFELPEID